MKPKKFQTRELRVRLNLEAATALSELMEASEMTATQVITQLIFTAQQKAKGQENDTSKPD